MEIVWEEAVHLAKLEERQERGRKVLYTHKMTSATGLPPCTEKKGCHVFSVTRIKPYEELRN